MASQDWVEKDFYKILGVTKGVADADLKKAYRKLAKDNHPDLHPGDQAAESRFKDISEAYDVLSDPAQRQEYDAFPFGGCRCGGDVGVDVVCHRLVLELVELDLDSVLVTFK